MEAWWPLDEQLGPTAAEIVNSNNGTHISNPSPTNGKVDYALSFNGENYVEVLDHEASPHLNCGREDLSIDAWIRTKKTDGIQVIVDKRDSSVRGYSLYLFNGKLGFQLATGSHTNYVWSSGPFIANGDWHHVAVTVDRNNWNGGTWYIDGSPNGNHFDPTPHGASLTNSSPLRIGSRSFAVSGLFIGEIDEVELFCRELQDYEIKAIYDAGPRGKCKVDVCISDGPLDTGAEPSLPQPPCGSYWCSPDIVVNHINSGGGPNLPLPAHQNPEKGQSNYAYAQVRNCGNATAYNVDVEIYLAEAATGLSWDGDWTSLGVSTVPILPVGETYLIDPVEWNPPETGHHCMVARLVTPQDMPTNETTSIFNNTKINNNIAWRNLNIVDLLRDRAVSVNFIMRQTSDVAPTRLVIRVTNEKGEPIALHPEVTTVTLGGLGTLHIDGSVEGFEMQETREGGISAKMTEEKASIGIEIAEGEEPKLSLTFGATALIGESPEKYVHVEQFEGKELVGGITYELRSPTARDTPLMTKPILDKFLASHD
jgi:hypothetical protein